MKVCFVMNSFSLYPTGGAKMVFEYANRLSERGHKVQILYLNNNAWIKYHLPEKIRRILVSCVSMFSPTWFSLNTDIKKLSYYDSKLDIKTKDTDVFIVTAVTTVEITRNRFKGRRFVYFIQDFENWAVSKEYVYKTYNLGMTNIVISKWLKDIVDSNSKKSSVLIKNPIDFEVYKINKKIENRKSHTIGLLYHTRLDKGIKYSLATIDKLKVQYPDLEVYMFGASKRPKDLPNWINYTCNASQSETVAIYNKVSVWLCATVDEGFGLTGLEAMACGCVLVSTAYKGVFEYAKEGYNALLVPVKDVNALVEAVVKVFEDYSIRKKLVFNAQETVRNFSWKKAVDKFEETLNEILN